MRLRLVGRPSLRRAAHDVLYIAEMAPGLRDPEVVALACRDERVLLTEDKDFGELTVRFGRSVPGLVLIRIDQADADLKAARLHDAIARYGARLFGRYVVIEQARMRVRELRTGD